MIELGSKNSFREMGLTENEFWRSLAPVLNGLNYLIEDRTITIKYCKGEIVIQLQTAFERKIASLKLPVLPVEIHFSDLTQSEHKLFLERFDRCFQRGGG